ncbi:MAG TPA: low affinity iron permease family protein [Candidatus Limnocylindrales bacterium]|nr:low affinity iron permease family protein [Candidatus Limnocylindrales bacterium]
MPKIEPMQDQGVRLADRFNRRAARVTEALGSYRALIASVLLVIVWAATGPVFHFSDTWQLFINTTTTVITFWMVFVIQNSSNRDAKAIHLKLDELLRVHREARNELITLEAAPEAFVARTAEELAAVAETQTGAAAASVHVFERVGNRKGEATAVAARGGRAPGQRAPRQPPAGQPPEGERTRR